MNGVDWTLLMNGAVIPGARLHLDGDRPRRAEVRWRAADLPLDQAPCNPGDDPVTLTIVHDDGSDQVTIGRCLRLDHDAADVCAVVVLDG